MPCRRLGSARLIGPLRATRRAARVPAKRGCKPRTPTTASAERALFFVWPARSKRVPAPSLSRGPLGERPLPGRARARRTGSGVAAVVAWVSARRTPRDTAPAHWRGCARAHRSEEHTSELQSPYDLVCRLLLEKKKQTK